jgi:hypothetical protein
VELAAAGSARDPPGHGQDSGQRGDREPDPVLHHVVVGQVAQPGVLARSDAVFDAGVAQVSSLFSAVSQNV